MKKLLLIVGMALTAQLAFAQESTEPNTLLGSGVNLGKIGFMVSPGVDFTKVAGEGTGFYQLKAGLVFNDKLTVGGFYGESFNEIRPQSFGTDYPASANVDLGIVGGFVEYTAFSNKLIHLTFPLMVGVLEMEGDDYGRGVEEGESRSWYFEPAAQLEVNIHRYARLYGGAGYRIMNEPSFTSGFIPEAGSAWSFQLGLKLGMFRIKN